MGEFLFPKVVVFPCSKKRGGMVKQDVFLAAKTGCFGPPSTSELGGFKR